MVSTCLVLLDCREAYGAKLPKTSVVSFFSVSGRNLRNPSPVMRPPRYQYLTGPEVLRNVSSRTLYRIKLLTLGVIKQRVRNCYCQLYVEPWDYRAKTQRPACFHTCLTCCQYHVSPGLTPQRYYFLPCRSSTLLFFPYPRFCFFFFLLFLFKPISLF